ncbi:MAG: twin-arginine translocation pathway signal protein [Thermoleophilia bacterium]|nr:twin-arginine translocation pathway signal protein [Thermoleophilia bacterium]
MSELETQEQLDEPRAKSALEQLESDHYSRGRFLKLVGGAGAVGAFGMLVAACGGDDKKSKTTASTMAKTTASTTSTMAPKGGDLEIVNYALTLEYLEAAFYAAAIDSGLFKGAELEAIKIIGQHEQEHVTALAAAAKSLGTPATEPKAKFPLEDRMSVLKLAATVENLGAAAYLGQAANIQDAGILAAGLSIHSVEARHAAALNTLIGENFVPDGAFAKAATMDEVLAAVKPFLVA